MTAISLHKRHGTPNWSMYWREYWQRQVRPPGAYDAMPRRAGDQEAGGGRLSGPFCRATDQHLRTAGLDPADVEAVMQILEKYRDDGEDQDPTIPIGGVRGAIGNPAPGGAQDRYGYDARFLDSFGRPRRNLARPAAAPSGPGGVGMRTSDFARRFPDAVRVKVL